jgi:vitamin B12 transporter
VFIILGNELQILLKNRRNELKQLIFTLTLILFFSSFVISEEKRNPQSQSKDGDILEYYIVVTPTRTEQNKSEVGSSITVITAEELKKTGKNTVVEALSTVPGLDIVQLGGTGKAASVFMRGTNSEHALVMVDGIEVNDPVSPGRSFDFAHLTVDSIKQIEIVRGPQSTLYGSDAIGGVIHIITKKGMGKPKFYLTTEGGSYKTFRESAGVSGGSEKVNYTVGISRQDTNGYSASGEQYGNTEKDGYGNTSANARLGLTPNENLEINLTARYIDAKSDLDNFEGEFGDDPNYTSDSKQLLLGAQGNLSLFQGKWEQKFGFYYNHIKRDYQNEVDEFNPSDSSQGLYKGTIFKADWQHNLYLGQTNTLTMGIEYEKETAESTYSWQSAWGPGKSDFPEKSSNTIGLYAQDNLKLGERFFVNIGFRYDNHNQFGDAFTYRIAPVFRLSNSTLIKATYGTGFKAPSLYQLYAPATDWGPIGNESLSPEKSKGWDLGIEQDLFNRNLVLMVTYFHNSIEDLILYDWMFGNANVSEAETSGLEFQALIQPFRNFSLQGNYTYTKTEDKDTGEQLLRRPKHKAGFNMNYNFLEKANLNLGIIYVGKRADIFPYPTRIETDAYTLVNVSLSYQVSRIVSIFCRIDNIFDEEYEVVKGYGTPGRSFYAGFKLTN